MLKLVVLLFAMVAVAFARPGFLHGYHAHPIVIPAAVSHTYRYVAFIPWFWSDV
nr:unnamed protein product [Callosobruchus chinensis]